MEAPGGEGDGDEEQQGLDGPARRGRDGAGADRRRGVIPLALEEPDPQGEHGDVAADQCGEGVRRLQRDAPAERDLADGGAEQRPSLGHHRELSEDERQCHPSPAGALDGLKGVAGAGQHPDDRPDPDQRADREQQVGPADALGLREFGHVDAGPGSHGGPQPGKQVLLVLDRGHGDWVQRRALQVHQGGAGGADIEHPGGRRAGALGACPDSHRPQYCGQVAVQATGRGRGGRAPEAPDIDALIGHDDGVAAERPVGDAGVAEPQHGQQNLIQGTVSEVGGLRQRQAVRHPGDQRRVPAGPEPAGGEHLRHPNPGAPGDQSEVGLVLDLLQAIQDQGGPRVPVQAEPP